MFSSFKQALMYLCEIHDNLSVEITAFTKIRPTLQNLKAFYSLYSRGWQLFITKITDLLKKLFAYLL